jgi:predicted ABC-type ATPase
MPATRPTIYIIIAGCNGAGETTFAKEFLPHEVNCPRFYNADEIARGLSPLDPMAGAIKAGRLLLNEVRESIDRQETFALETTLSGKTYWDFQTRTFVRLRVGITPPLAGETGTGHRARASSC